MLTPQFCRNTYTVSTGTYPTSCCNQKDRRTYRRIFHSVLSFYAVCAKGLKIQPAAILPTVGLQVTYNTSLRSLTYMTFATIITLKNESPISLHAIQTSWQLGPLKLIRFCFCVANNVKTPVCERHVRNSQYYHLIYGAHILGGYKILQTCVFAMKTSLRMRSDGLGILSFSPNLLSDFCEILRIRSAHKDIKQLPLYWQ
jgi:hypothetical protein